MAEKIISKRTIINLTGDEMAQVAWEKIQEQINRFVEINVETYDLSLGSRFKTDGKIIADSIAAIRKAGTGVKCAGITPNKAQVEETCAALGIAEDALQPTTKKSPNGRLRKGIDCHVMFRGDVGLPGVKALIPGLTGNPIDVARHGQGDDYEAFDATSGVKGKIKIIEVDESGHETVIHERDTGEGDPVMFMKNNLPSIEQFARSTFQHGLQRKFPVVLGTKNTILQQYDNVFKEMFDRVFEVEFKDKFKAIGLEGEDAYRHQLIDALAAKMLSSRGNFVLAVRNFMGDVCADQMAEIYGSLATFSSVLKGADEVAIFEAPHGTAPDLYETYKATGEAMFNPIASQVAWTGALRHAGEREGNQPLIDFADKYDQAIKDVVGEGAVTPDLAGRLEDNSKVNKVDLEGFLAAVETKLG